MSTDTRTDLERFNASWISDPDTGCWNWQGTISPKGYGTLTLRCRHTRAARLAFTLFRGEIPTGRVIDHLCRNRACVNPGHLRIATIKENNTAPGSESFAATNKNKTHCSRGHEYTAENTIIRPTGRDCRKCKGLRETWRSRRAAAALADDSAEGEKKP